jgi:uracil DNA glycosylase
MSHKLDLNEIKDKIYEKLKPSGWARVLHGFIYSTEFDNIIIALAKQSKDGKRFTPTMKNWFRAFEECPYEDLKVVIVGQD